MKNLDAVIDALDVLWNNVETKFERHRVRNLILDLLKGPPKVEQIDDTHQKFNGVTYRKDKTGHYHTTLQIQREVWNYYYGVVSPNVHIHHKDFNPDNNDIDNLQALSQIEHRSLHMRITAKKINDNPQFTERICAYCGKKFLAKNNRNKKFCSVSCRQKNQRRSSLMQRKCKFCGKTYTVYKHGRNKFCSRSCASKFNHPKQEVMLIQAICPICGKEFETNAKKPRKTCSRQCQAKLQSKTLKEKIIQTSHLNNLGHIPA